MGPEAEGGTQEQTWDSGEAAAAEQSDEAVPAALQEDGAAEGSREGSEGAEGSEERQGGRARRRGRDASEHGRRLLAALAEQLQLRPRN